MSRITHPVSKYSKSGRAVPDMCAGTIPTVEACMMTLRHLTFVGCEIDIACFDASMPFVVQVFPRRVLNIVRPERVRGGAKISLEARKVILGSRRIMHWDSPPCLFAMQSFPMHISHFLSKKLKESTVIQIDS